MSDDRDYDAEYKAAEDGAEAAARIGELSALLVEAADALEEEYEQYTLAMRIRKALSSP